jgi:hypothetical protein
MGLLTKEVLISDHIWEYDGYGGYDACDVAISNSQVSTESERAGLILHVMVILLPSQLLTGVQSIHRQGSCYAIIEI